MRVIKVVLVVAIVLLGTGCVRYVSLGDSYTAGPGIPKQQRDPTGCVHSDRSYPWLVAMSLHGGAVLHDVSCSGATTADMSQFQAVTGGANPPQFRALDTGTRVVSLTIGANDIGFMQIAYICSSAVNVGTPCRHRYVVNGDDRIADRIAATAPRVAGVLRGIRARASHAKIFVVGYLDILPENGHSCFPQVRFTAR